MSRHTVISSLNPSRHGQAVTFTATVTASAPGLGLPTGTITFKDKNKTLGTATLSSAGQATFTTSTLSNGSHPITAAYGGSSGFLTSTSATLPQTVSP